MAQIFVSQNPSLAAHLETCPLHGSEAKAICSGIMKRRGVHCVKNATGPFEEGIMPLCTIHKDQQKQSSWCRAPLDCGIECGRICLWRPHGFQLCIQHLEEPMSCYLLKIPIEIRLRIYSLLFPCKLIPARHSYPGMLPPTEKGLLTTLIRTHPQIRDEAVRFLYAARVFAIEVNSDGLTMCHSQNSPTEFPNHGNHSLQDYQMQMMLLEQQNRRRIQMARGVQAVMLNSGYSNPSNIPIVNLVPLSSVPAVIPSTYGPDSPAWEPPLNTKNFDIIQSFVIEIVFHRPAAQVSSRPLEDHPKVLEWKLYDYCDTIHKLVGRFQLMPRPLTRLEVLLKFGKTQVERERMISMAQFFLRPFQRLRNIENVTIPKITFLDFENQEIDIFDRPEADLSANDISFRQYLDSWSSDLRSSGPVLQSPVFKAFWQLEQLLKDIKGHQTDPKFASFQELLHDARVAREADDVLGFREAWDAVLKLWFEYVDDQKNFEANVSLSIDEIGRALDGDL